MIEFAALSGPVQATLVVAAILLQAVALYVGYGVLERVFTPLIQRLASA
ncbi:DUF7512 family protein [Natrarchaeobaculum sulfurireducens]|nr:hypothetical protein [Natrarchaeobaculum sulfurireducens]